MKAVYLDYVFWAFLAGVFLVMALIVGACTYNVSMAHTTGTASDVIDDTQSPQNTVSPNLNLTKPGL